MLCYFEIKGQSIIQRSAIVGLNFKVGSVERSPLSNFSFVILPGTGTSVNDPVYFEPSSPQSECFFAHSHLDALVGIHL